MVGRRISTTHLGSDARQRLKSSGLGIDEILVVDPYSEKKGLQRAWQMSHASFMFCLRELLVEEGKDDDEVDEDKDTMASDEEEKESIGLKLSKARHSQAKYSNQIK